MPNCNAADGNPQNTNVRLVSGKEAGINADHNRKGVYVCVDAIWAAALVLGGRLLTQVVTSFTGSCGIGTLTAYAAEDTTYGRACDSVPAGSPDRSRKRRNRNTHRGSCSAAIRKTSGRGSCTGRTRSGRASAPEEYPLRLGSNLIWMNRSIRYS